MLHWKTYYIYLAVLIGTKLIIFSAVSQRIYFTATYHNFLYLASSAMDLTVLNCIVTHFFICIFLNSSNVPCLSFFSWVNLTRWLLIIFCLVVSTWTRSHKKKCRQWNALKQILSIETMGWVMCTGWLKKMRTHILFDKKPIF